MFKKLYNITRNLFQLLKHKGGLHLIKKISQICVREGWDGILFRLKHFGTKSGGTWERHFPITYEKWVKKYGTYRGYKKGTKHERLLNLRNKPFIYILILGEENLSFTKQSVINQIYSNWKIITKEDKIKTGEIILVIKGGAILEQDALLTFAEVITEKPGNQLYYSDDDFINQEQKQFNPNFKPDWNPDLFLSSNYISGIWAFINLSKEFIEYSTLPKNELEEWQYLLHLIDNLKFNSIIHIPYILLHKTLKSQPPSREGASILKNYLSNKGENTDIITTAFGYKINRFLPDPQPLVSLIIPTRNGFELLHQCIESILNKTNYSNFEIIVVDNQSDDLKTISYLKELETQGTIKLIHYNKPFNYSAINNFAVKYTNGTIIGLINNDIEVISSNWLLEMVGHAVRKEIGAVGAKLYYPDGRIQHAGVILGLGGVAGHAFLKQPKDFEGMGSRCFLVQNLSAVTAACLIIKRDIYYEVGGLDEKEFAVAFNDIDFCLRVREKGYRNLWTPYAELIHHESATRGHDDTPEKKERFMKEVHNMNSRWGQILFRDPAYNPNLNLTCEDFSPSMPTYEKN